MVLIVTKSKVKPNTRFIILESFQDNDYLFLFKKGERGTIEQVHEYSRVICSVKLDGVPDRTFNLYESDILKYVTIYDKS